MFAVAHVPRTRSGGAYPSLMFIDPSRYAARLAKVRLCARQSSSSAYDMFERRLDGFCQETV